MTPFDLYVRTLPSGRWRDLYVHVLDVIRDALPEAEEGTAYGMPAFKVNGSGVFGLMIARHFMSIYPFSETTLKSLDADLADYDHTRGALHFTPDRPVTDELIHKIARTRVAELAG